jgi:tRNA-specific 2-thiouridylase
MSESILRPQTGLRRVAVAMSGGVDSTLAAILLVESGFDVIGVTLKLQECDTARESSSCCGSNGIARARSAAGRLGIPHYVVDCVQEFSEQILRPAWEEYANGRTPSPCLRCNEKIKFGSLLRWANQLGIHYLATGHYARIEQDPDGSPVLLRGVDKEKDQSYFLAGLDRTQLASILFPLGNMNKQEVRERARAHGMENADAPDSQDACLVSPGQSFSEMLCERFHGIPRPGPVTDPTGRIIGRHDGIHRFTIGQRKGIPVQSTEKQWVCSIRSDDASVAVTTREDDLLSDHFVSVETNWLRPPLPSAPTSCQAQVRYRHKAEAATIVQSGPATLDVSLACPVRAITPGQAAVFYDGERVLGRGWIRA